MGKKSKLVLDKNTVKSIKVKTEVKTGNPNGGGSNNTMACAGVGGANPAQNTSMNYSRGVASAF